MPYFHKLKLLYLHIPKCGGSTIEYSLSNISNPTHSYTPSNFSKLKKALFTYPLFHKAINSRYVLRNKRRASNASNLFGEAGTQFLQHLTLNEIIDYNYLPLSVISQSQIFASVRHPYARLISAYHYWKPEFNLSFSDFVSHSLDSPNSIGLSLIHRKHIMPQSCYLSNQYSLHVIKLKLENLYHDAHANLPLLANVLDPQLSLNRSNSNSTIKYSISSGLAERIYSYYKSDFSILDYNSQQQLFFDIF